jgi:hypothetical protein
MVKEETGPLNGEEKNALLKDLETHLSKSKAELVTEIEENLSARLGRDVRQAFDSVATTQRIRGGGMNLDRAHKSALVLLAYVLSQGANKSGVIKS